MPTYPLAFPSVGIVSSSFRLSRAVSASRSPFTFARQAYKHQGAMWSGEVTFRPTTDEQAAELRSFIVELNGKFGTFLYGDPDRLAKGILGVGGGTPLVNGASQTGTSLVVDAAPLSTTDWLKKGDYFQLGTGVDAQLYMLVDDVTSDGSGNATLTFEPSLRSSPSDNDAVTITSPKGLFSLSANDTGWQSNHVPVYEISISFEEVISL
jgi:hypothetical protein